MDNKASISLRIDGRDVTVDEGATILDAARQAGIRIPTLCHHPALPPYGGCRLCVVEVDGAPRLAASCVMPVRAGMDVVTVNERILETRKTVLEFLFSERPHHCMVCSQSGDCELQSLAYEHGLDHFEVPGLNDEFPLDTTHPDLVLDHNRCVLCGRCVRACRDVAGNMVLDFHNRGGRAMIGADLSDQLGQSSCVSCGLCLQVCPTGALYLRHRTHYAVGGKARDRRSVPSVCPSCGLLCPTVNEVLSDHLIRITTPWDNPGAAQGQLCRKGRLDPFRELGPRLSRPMIRNEEGEWAETSEEEAQAAAGRLLAGWIRNHGRSTLFGLISGRRSNEEAAAFRRFMTIALEGARIDTLAGNAFRNLSRLEETGVRGEPPIEAAGEADFLLFLGDGFAQSHPILLSLARKARLDHGAPLIVLGPKNPLGPWASIHLSASASETKNLLNRLANGEAGNDNLEEVRIVAQAWAEARHPLLVLSPEYLAASDPGILHAALALAGRKRTEGKDAGVVPLRPEGNSAGLWGVGAASTEPWNEPERFRGGLVVLDGDELPDADETRALAAAEALAVITPYQIPTWMEKAAVLLPTPTLMEIEGHFASYDGGRSVFKTRVRPAPQGVRPLEDTLALVEDHLRSALKARSDAGGRPMWMEASS
jgi:formate dehydrogenase major subunit